MLRNLSLQNKIILMVTVVTILLMSVIVMFDAYSLRESVEETYVSQLTGMTIAINGRYEESHSIDDVQQIFDYIHYRNKDVIRLTLYDMSGVVLSSTDRDLIGSRSPDELLQAVKQSRTMVTHMTHDPDKLPKVRLVAPLNEDGIVIGSIELLLNSSEESTLIRERVQRSLIVGSLISILLLGLLWLIIRRLLILPLLKLREAAASVKQGKAYEKVELQASQEINEVAHAFNDMVSNLEDRYQELQQVLNTLQQTQRQLVESEKMVALGNLVAGVSHEINTPIGIGVTAVSFLDQRTGEFVSLYRDNKMKKSDLEQYIQNVGESVAMIQANLQRASELIRGFKQIAVDQSSEVKRKFKMQEYMNEVVLSLKPSLKKTQHEIQIVCDENLEIYSYPGAFSQVMTNFVMNSLIHAYEPGERGNLVFHASKKNQQLIMKYSDDGKGMPAEIRDRIFEPFFTTNRGGGGTGLGMHIVYNIVTQSLGGTIHCESEVGRGTTFIIHIPLGQEGENHE